MNKYLINITIIILIVGLNIIMINTLNKHFDNEISRLETNQREINTSQNSEQLAFQEIVLKDEIEKAKLIVSKNYNIDTKWMFFGWINQFWEFYIEYSIDNIYYNSVYVNIDTNTIIIK